jgi:hypothetical protein
MMRSRPLSCEEIPRGKTFWYFRRGKGLRIRIRGSTARPRSWRPRKPRYGATRLNMGGQRLQWHAFWLIRVIKKSRERLSVATKSQRGNIYKAAIQRAGNAHLAKVTRHVMEQAVEDWAKTPFAANDFLKKAMPALFA